jgi:iron uptake system EfeUOB component EfeO/EfeM
MRRAPAISAACLACAALAGCGGAKQEAAPNPPAAPLSARVLTSGNIPRVRAADFEEPLATYRRYVLSELQPMQGDVDTLATAVSANDLAAARRAWLAADSRYEAIGAAYGAFGDLDAAINGEPAGLAGGVHSPDFTGLHRIELALWGRDSTADAAPYTARLAADLRKLRATVPGIEIEPLEYVLRSHEVLEGSLDLQLSGRASPWSSDALVALRSNLRGTEAVLGSLRPLIVRRNRQVLPAIDSSLAALGRGLEEVAGPGGAMPRWDSLPAAQRTMISARTAGAAEQLSYIPEIVDPRPPLPQKSAFGTEEAG